MSNESHQNSRTAMFSTGTEYAYGDYYESAGTVSNVEDKITELQKILQEYPEDKDIKWEIEKLKNQCTMFNKTASTYIDSAQKLK